MPGISHWVQRRTVVHPPIVTGGMRLILESQVVVVGVPFARVGVFWAGPSAVGAERNGQNNRRHEQSMTETARTTFATVAPRDLQALEFFDTIFGAARASAVYSAPVTAGAYTIITACEVSGGGAFGSGHGFGPGDRARTSPDDAAPGHSAAAGGGGTGGGGGATGRPVAVIVVGPDGVQVKPIFDVTKLGLAALTTWGAMLMTLLQLRRRKRLR